MTVNKIEDNKQTIPMGSVVSLESKFRIQSLGVEMTTTTRERVWIQHLPQGDFAVASYETDDPEKSFKVLATSNKPWAVKFREHLNKAHGLDIAQSSMQLNEVAVNWK